MLSLQRSSHQAMPWFARPVHENRPVITPHRQHHQFLLAASQESASTSSTSTAEAAENNVSFYPSSIVEQAKSTRRNCHGDFIDLPSDPRCWLREDVQTWILHLAAVHGLPAVQSDRFLMNGKALCLMTMEMFCQRVPLGGKMLYKDFQLRLSMAMYNNNNK